MTINSDLSFSIKLIETTSLILFAKAVCFLKSQVSITLLKNVVKLVASKYLRTDSQLSI